MRAMPFWERWSQEVVDREHTRHQNRVNSSAVATLNRVLYHNGRTSSSTWDVNRPSFQLQFGGGFFRREFWWESGQLIGRRVRKFLWRVIRVRTGHGDAEGRAR